MDAYKKLAVKNGTDPDSVFPLKPGDNIVLDRGRISKGERIPTRDVLVHRLGVGDIGKVVLGDRAVLGNEGFVAVVYKLKGNALIGDPLIVSRGFVFERVSKELIMEASRRLRRQVLKLKRIDKAGINDETQKYLSNFLFQKTGRRPMILPVVVEV